MKVQVLRNGFSGRYEMTEQFQCRVLGIQSALQCRNRNRSTECIQCWEAWALHAVFSDSERKIQSTEPSDEL